MEMIKVRGLVGCAGQWGSIYEGEEKYLSRDIAESLFRANYAEPVASDETTSAEIEKKDAAPRRRKSKPASES